MIKFGLGVALGVYLAIVFPRETQHTTQWMQQEGAVLMQQGADQLRAATSLPGGGGAYQDQSQQPYSPAGSRYQATGNPVPLH